MILNIISGTFYDCLEALGIPWESYQGREDYLTITSQLNGDVVLVSLQDENHKILEVLWEKEL